MTIAEQLAAGDTSSILSLSTGAAPRSKLLLETLSLSLSPFSSLPSAAILYLALLAERLADGDTSILPLYRRRPRSKLHLPLFLPTPPLDLPLPVANPTPGDLHPPMLALPFLL